MGFSLQMFFESLNECFDDELSADEQILALQYCIKVNKEYAKQCGQID